MPAVFEMRLLFLWKARVVQNNTRRATLWPERDTRDRIHAPVPVSYAPHLDESAAAH